MGMSHPAGLPKELFLKRFGFFVPVHAQARRCEKELSDNYPWRKELWEFVSPIQGIKGRKNSNEHSLFNLQ